MLARGRRVAFLDEPHLLAAARVVVLLRFAVRARACLGEQDLRAALLAPAAFSSCMGHGKLLSSRRRCKRSADAGTRSADATRHPRHAARRGAVVRWRIAFVATVVASLR